MSLDKIVITGFGVIAPNADNTEEFSTMLQKGICGLSKIENVGPNGESIIGGEIEDKYITIKDKNYKRYPKFVRLAIESAEEAFEMSNLRDLIGKRVSVVSATSTGGVKEVEYYTKLVSEGKLKEFPIQVTALCNNHSIATGVASHFGIKHQAFTVNNSCNAGVDAMYLAKMLLETNQTDLAIVTGAESPFTTGMIYSFNKTRTVLYDQKLEDVGRPFSKNSKGYALSEGAATIIMERESDAEERNTQVYGWVKRIGLSFDSVSILQSDPTGEVMYEAVEQACLDEIPDYVNSQALGLKENDMVEMINHKKRFQTNVPITTIKGNVGQSLGVMALIQVVSTLISMKENFIPATIRTDLEGYEDLPVVLETVNQPVEKVLVTSHGFGGNNGSVFLEKIRG